MPKIEEDGKSWLRRPKLYKGVVEPYKKKKKNRTGLQNPKRYGNRHILGKTRSKTITKT